MKFTNRISPSSGNSGSPDQIATFVVVESSTCRVPALTYVQTDGRNSADYDSDYMPDVYSYPLQEGDSKERNGKVVNMRVNIKMRVNNNNKQGSVAPPSSPSTGLRFRPPGGVFAPPSTPTNSSSDFAKVTRDINNNSIEFPHLLNYDVTEGNYGHHARNSKANSRNRSAPPVMSQYRSRLTNTSQWVKKRAVAELTSVRNNPKTNRPATSVRPFSERESPVGTNSYRTRMRIHPPHPPSLISIPDFGSFRGKPPISLPTRSISRQKSHPTGVQKDKPRDGERENATSSKIFHSSPKSKVEQYVSELRKSIKMQKPGVSARKRLKPFAVWAIFNSDENPDVSPELEKLDDVRNERPLTPTGNVQISKTDHSHSVRRQVIKRLSDGEEKENSRRLNLLEVKGDIPPGVATTQLHDTTTNNDHAVPSETSQAFPRGKTTLATAAQKGSMRYARQIAPQNTVPPPKILDKTIFQRSTQNNPQSLARDVESETTTLPYIQLHRSVTDYKVYKQSSAPFVRTLI